MVLPSRTIVARSGEVGDLEKTLTIRMMVKRNMTVSMRCQIISVMIIESLHGKRFITFVVIFLYFIWCENTQYYFIYVEVRGVCVCT